MNIADTIIEGVIKSLDKLPLKERVEIEKEVGKRLGSAIAVDFKVYDDIQKDTIARLQEENDGLKDALMAALEEKRATEKKEMEVRAEMNRKQELFQRMLKIDDLSMMTDERITVAEMTIKVNNYKKMCADLNKRYAEMNKKMKKLNIALNS